ncbi:Zn-ribbon-containing protein [Vibrio sp. SCSIO 43136]|uniref:Zn-ribbon-containing protein n=1 Tax=Vibrio sp. SCSIO 43136 TaxID=2819101 RepID=UPI002075DD0E|nr:Zn-ribbon-containing protein [Vibrio sp. SCSIO 43136]USD65888.1 Zn-ribbon-containing protein [Vibrio sp. SCSIO 43136]
MYITEISFELYRDTSMGEVEKSINYLLDCLRYNGQVIGRELPVAMEDGSFTARVVCPEADSLHPQFFSPQVKHAINQLADAGLLQPKVRVVGQDMNSDPSDEPHTPSWQVLYTSYLHTCSPIRCGDHFQPVPLYRLPAVANGDQKQIIKWQEDWSACDQLQMNGSVVEHPSLHEISSSKSLLFKRGWDLCRRMKVVSGIPTYLYIYRVGGVSKEEEQARVCPVCGGEWALESPIHGVFDFKCDECMLVSNLSWDFKD